MVEQVVFRMGAKRRGCHLITGEIVRRLPVLPEKGLLNENTDPDVRGDMSRILDRLVKENEPYYEHTMEGADDMPAHAKCSLIGASLTIPITNGRLNLGTWQGIYLCEFRDYGGEREIVMTVYG